MIMNSGFDLHHFSKKLQADNLLVSYKGPFSPAILSEIADYIKDHLPVEVQTSRKMLKMFIEMAQNISYYSAEVNRIGMPKERERVGLVVIGELEDHFFMTTGNMLQNDYVRPVKERCNLINSLNREELRNHGGANIGLVVLALTSDNPLEPEVAPIDEKFSFFSLTVTIDK
jgi:hypothetical protein